MLAVMKAGGAFVPLDPSHPIPRLQALARSVDAALVLCSRRHLELLGAISDVALAVDDDTINRLSVTKSARISQVNSSNAAYAIFTSGSTGEPKVPSSITIHIPCRALIVRRELSLSM
jgi:non-ribosomal peptide synthetase component F